MKNIITITLILFSISLFSQEVKNLKPEGKNISFETSFYPNDPFAPINMSYLRGRYFITNNIAIRMGIDFSNKKDIDEELNIAYDNGGIAYQAPNNKTENKYTTFGFHPGVELHFLTENKRISPYIGAELYFTNKKSSSNIEAYFIEHDWQYDSYSHEKMEYEYTNVWSNGNERAYKMFGFNAIIGTDIYLTKHLFMGVELGIGYQSKKDLEIKRLDKTDDDEVVLSPEDKTTDLGLYINTIWR